MSLKVQKIHIDIFMLMSSIQRTVTHPISLELHVSHLLQQITPLDKNISMKGLAKTCGILLFLPVSKTADLE